MKDVCYLCGRSDPDTKDHVPPKTILPKGIRRMTLPAHRACNNEFSADEEYFRDVVGPPALDYPDGSDVFWASRRAWQRPQGRRRLRMILRGAKPVELRSKTGLYVGRGIQIAPDMARIVRVAGKVGRGVIFEDTGTVVASENIVCARVPAAAVQSERDAAGEDGRRFWDLMAFEQAYHTNFSPSVACRRVYRILASAPILRCEVNMVLVVYAEAFLMGAEIEIPDPRPGLLMVAVESEGTSRGG